MSTNLRNATAMRSVHASLFGRSGRHSFRSSFSLLLLLALLLVSGGVWGQTTYTWTGSMGNSWIVAGNWADDMLMPRTLPDADDILVISTDAAITNVPNQTIGRLQINGGATVTLSTSGAGVKTLTISNVGNALEIASGSTLTLTGNDGGGSRTLTLAFSGMGNTASIAGNLNLDSAGTNDNGVFNATNSTTIVTGEISNNGGSVTSTAANLTFSGGTYVNNRSGGTIPTATWEMGANCNVEGTGGTIAGLNQSFFNLTWDRPSQTNNQNFPNTGTMSIAGNLEVISTGTGRLQVSQTILTVSNFSQSGGVFRLAINGASRTLETGDFSVTGGDFLINDGNGNADGLVIVSGDYTHTHGDIVDSNIDVAPTQALGTIQFDGNTVCDSGNGTGMIVGTIDFVVNTGATLQMINENTVITSDLTALVPGSFTLQSGATLGITSPFGITTAACMSDCGNIQTATRTFAPAANYLYNGTIAQSTGDGLPATLIGDLEIDNPLGVALTAPQIINMPGTLRLTEGNLTTDATNLLTLGDDVTVVPDGGSSASFVNGPVQKIGNDAFKFPTGDGTTYGPIGISAPAPGAVTDAFQAEYFAAAPESPTMLGMGIAEITDREYWDLEKISADPASVSVILRWIGNDMAAASDIPNLRVAHFVGGEWVSAGGNSVGDPELGGMIMSEPVDFFSPFTLGSVVALNPLPIELVSFTATPKSKTVQLDWRTASELNNAFFEIERSSNGRDFENIGKVAGAGTSQTPHNYEFTDLLPLNDWNYYRLRQVDFDGQFSFSPVEAVFMGKSGAEIRLLVFPNPANNELNLKTDRLLQAGDRIEIYDYTGRQVLNVSASDAVSAPIAVSQLPAGTYIVRLRTADGVVSTSFVKQ
ncbi:MAG: T9SS type A sorting domain-containing protein [Saprospiraceae bacterium]